MVDVSSESPMTVFVELESRSGLSMMSKKCLINLGTGPECAMSKTFDGSLI